MTAQTTQADRPALAPIPPARFHHIGFRTARGKEMSEFYRVFLGVHPTLEIEGFASFYTFDLAHHRVVLFYDSSITQATPTVTGVQHVAFQYDSVDDLMRLYQRLKQQNICPIFAVNHGTTTSLYYRDPDQNVIELLTDNFGPDPRRSLEAMYALKSSPNQKGVFMNPETYLAAWQAGATLAELHQRSYAGEFSAGALMPPRP